MDDLRKKLDAKEGDVSSSGGIVTVHLESEILFPSGEAELSKRGKEVLARVGDVLKPLKDKQILVGGHTDDAPIHTARFPSNWELSTARAVNVVHFLADNAGVDPAKLTAAGYSQYHPRSADRAQNRRIEILLIPSVASPTPQSPPTSRREMKRPLGLVLGARQRRAIGVGCFVEARRSAAQQIGARRVIEVIAVERVAQHLDEREARAPAPSHLRDRDRAVERDHRRRVHRRTAGA